MASRRSGLKVNDADLMCRNNCGFYGNPSWHYYCSVCYRNVYLKKTQTSKVTSQELSQSSVTSFSKFEEKRKSVTSKGQNTMKSIFKMNREAESIDDNSDAIQAKNRFEQFISKLKKAAAIDINKQVKIYLDTLEETKHVKIEQHSVLVQKFYERLSDRIKNESPYKGITEEQSEKLLAEVERYLTIQIYDWAFKPNFSDDESEDLQLQKRIRSLYWITPEIIDAAIDEENGDEKVHLDEAITAMIEMNTKLCPEDKLDCIVRCCKSVFSALQTHANFESNNSSPKLVNADDFLPALILVLIRANPTLLYSNMQFVMRFTRPSLINSGEVGYMFTNLSVAIEFINKCDHKDLNMTEQQFSDALKGIKPKKGPFKLDQKLPLEATFTALRILDNNEILLKKLDEKTDIHHNNLIQLENELQAYETSFNNKVESIKQDIVLQFKTDYNGDIDHDIEVSNKTAASYESLLDEHISTDLPPPLAPMKSKAQIDKENMDYFLK